MISLKEKFNFKIKTNLIMLHVNMNKSHVKIIMLNIDIIILHLMA